MLPETIQKLFCDRDEWLQLKGSTNSKIQRIWTTKRTFSISTCGIKSWNSLMREQFNSGINGQALLSLQTNINRLF